MADFTKYIDPIGGNDSTGDGSFSTPWKTPAPIIGGGVTWPAGNNVTVICLTTAGVCTMTDLWRFFDTVDGATFTIRPGTGADDTVAVGRISTIPASFFCQFSVNTQGISVTFENVDHAGAGGSGLGFLFDACGDITPHSLTVRNSTFTNVHASPNLISGNAAAVVDITLDNVTATAMKRLWSGPIIPNLDVQNCIFSIVAGETPAATPAGLIDFIFNKNIVTGALASNKDFIELPNDAALTVIEIEDNIITLTGNSTEITIYIPDSGISTSLSIRRNTITTDAAHNLYIGSGATGDTRANILSTLRATWRKLAVEDNILTNNDPDDTGTCLWAMIGFNSGKLRRNTMVGGSGAHTFEVAGSDNDVSYNHITGQLGLFISGDRNDVHNNTSIDSGFQQSIPGGTSWEYPADNKVYNNILISTGTEAFKTGVVGGNNVTTEANNNILYRVGGGNIANIDDNVCANMADIVSAWAGVGGIYANNDTETVIGVPDIDAYNIPIAGGNCDVGRGKPGFSLLGESDILGRPVLRTDKAHIGPVYPQRDNVENILKPLVKFSGEMAVM